MNNSFRELNSVKTASICSYTNNVSKHTERQHQSTKVYWKPTMLRPNKNPATNEASNTHCCPEQSTTCRPMCRRHGRHNSPITSQDRVWQATTGCSTTWAPVCNVTNIHNTAAQMLVYRQLCYTNVQCQQHRIYSNHELWSYDPVQICLLLGHITLHKTRCRLLLHR